MGSNPNACAGREENNMKKMGLFLGMMFAFNIAQWITLVLDYDRLWIIFTGLWGISAIAFGITVWMNERKNDENLR